MLTQKYHLLFIILAHSTHSSVCSLIRRIMVSLWGCSTFLSSFEILLLMLSSILGSSHFASGLPTKFEALQVSIILRTVGKAIAHMGCQFPIINEMPAVIALNITVTVTGHLTTSPVSYTHLDVYKRQLFALFAARGAGRGLSS